MTLVWTDPPATINANNALINNLDLTATDPAGRQVLPMVVNLGQDGANGATNLGGPVQGVDDSNNIEQVQVPNAAAGEWTITVAGILVPEGPQPFALIATGTRHPYHRPFQTMHD